MGRQMRSAVNIAGKYAAAITAAGAAIATHLVRQSLQAIDRQSKLARQLDTTQASIAGLTRAAELSGIEQSKLEKNIQAYNKRLGEAIDGQGEAKAAMDKLGLSAKQLAEMPLDEQLAIIAERTNGLSTAAEKAAVASDLFSRAGLDMINMFEGGADSIRQARVEAEAFGLAVDDVDARQIEMANDAMSSISATMRGFFNRVAVKLAPIIRAIAEQFRQTAIETEGFQAQLDQAVRMGVQGAHFLGNAWRGIQVIIKGLELGFSGFNLMVFEAVRGVSQAVTDLVTDAISKINWLSEAANNIPGINIPLVDDSGIRQTQQLLNDLSASARDKVERTKKELHELLMEPLPTDGLEDWIASVQEAGRKAAEAVRDEQARVAADAQEQGGQGDPEAEARKGQLENRLNQLREGLMSEREVEMEHQMQRGEILREAFERDLLTFQEFKRLTEEAAAAHQKRMTEIEKEGLDEREKFQRSGLRSQAKTIFGQLDTITAGVSQHNKELFKINQMAGIANAIISAYEGIALTMSKYPYPLNVAMAAAHATAAFAQVNAIRSATFSGGGGSAPSLSGGTAAPPSSEVGRDGGGRQQAVMIRMEGSESSTFTRQQVRDLIDQINEASDDGAKVVVS